MKSVEKEKTAADQALLQEAAALFAELSEAQQEEILLLVVELLGSA